MSDIPVLETQEHYDTWIAQIAHHEADEFLSEVDEEDQNYDTLVEYVDQSPQLVFEKSELVEIYYDVLEYAQTELPYRSPIENPAQEDLLNEAAAIVNEQIRRDVVNETANMLENDYDVEI